MKRNSTIREALSFDDVLLVPAETQVKPDTVSTKTRLTRDIEMNIPLIAAGHDNVTESAMAIRMAQLGGIGIIHSNMPPGKQVEEVRRVKKAEGEVTENPITIAAESSAAEALDLMTTYKISGLPVVEQGSQKVIGIITDRDLRYFEDHAQPVSGLMSRDVITAPQGISQDDAKRLMHEKRVKKLIINDAQGRAAGLMTVKDIEKMSRYPGATRDAKGMLRVGAAVSQGKDAFDRTAAMVDAGLDVVVIDVAHAHTRDVIGTVSRIRQQKSSAVQIIAGNVVTADAARSLVDAGADAIKVGIGALPSSASRRLGMGMPQFTALLEVAEQCEIMNIPVIVDGDISSAANLIKALGAGAQSAFISDIFAGTEEAPGDIFYNEARAFKILNAAAQPQHRMPANLIQHDPYHLDENVMDTSVPFRGPVGNVVQQLVTALRMSMAYTGSADLYTFRENAVFVRTK